MYPFQPKKDPLKDVQYPNPPDWYKNYSKENIKRGICYPPPPLPSTFQIFGETYDLKAHVIPPIETKGVQRVFGETRGIGDIKREMTKINRSIMAAFIDLTQILIGNPQSDDRIEKINNIRVLFLNFHNLINELRPIQARATIVANQKQTYFRTHRLSADITETLAATQAALLTTKLLPRKLPSIPIPFMPELDEEEALALPSIDYVSLMEPVKAEDDFTEIYTETKSRRQLAEEAYILQNWKDPPKKLKERYIYRDKLVALKDEPVIFCSSDEDADDERTEDELESSSAEEDDEEEGEEAENQEEDEEAATVEEEGIQEELQETAEAEMEVDPTEEEGEELEEEETASKSDESRNEEESDIEDSTKGSPRYQSPPPPEVQKLLRQDSKDSDDSDEQQSSSDSEISKEPVVQELRREIVDDQIKIFQGMPKYYDRNSFEQYYKARGCAPDQDEEVLKVLRKRERIRKLQEKEAYLSSDEEESDEEPKKKKKKVQVLEILEDDAIPPTTTNLDDGEEDESGEEEIYEFRGEEDESEKQKENPEEDEEREESEEEEEDSSDFDSSDFSFSDFSEVENSSDLSSDSSDDDDDETFLIESTIEATIGIPSMRRLDKADEEDDDDEELIRKPRKPVYKPKPVPIESSDSDSEVEAPRRRYKAVTPEEDDEEDIESESDKILSSDVSDSEVIDPDPASGSTLEGTVRSQEDSDALLASSPENVVEGEEGDEQEDEAMEASDNDDSNHETAADEQRPESLQELNRPSSVASSSPFDDDQPPVLEPIEPRRSSRDQ